MPILVDINQVQISNLMIQLAMNNGAGVVEESMVRHMVLNSLRGYRKKFGDKYGELVICCDDRHYWRKQMFPYYKASRKKSREDSSIDWNSVFDILNKIREELREYMPYKVIQVEHAEADDIIGSVCNKYGTYLNTSDAKQILVLSGDKDFIQLQKYANVSQYAPVQKKMLTIDNPERFLREHIMLGDSSDGIPNFLSDDDTFTTSKRQRPVSRVKLANWVTQKPEEFCNEEMLRNYKRNELLINLEKIPEEIQDKCCEQFSTVIAAPRSGILNYFVQSRLTTLTENIGDF